MDRMTAEQVTTRTATSRPDIEWEVDAGDWRGSLGLKGQRGDLMHAAKMAPPVDENDCDTAISLIAGWIDDAVLREAG